MKSARSSRSRKSAPRKRAVPGIRLLAGIEVDILKNGKLDLDNEVLAQLDVVVASVHSYMNLERAEMTERMLAAIENPYTQIIAHPTGRLLLRREAFDYDMEKILDAAARARRRDGMQRLSGPAGFERCASADGEAARREDCDFHGLAFDANLEIHEIWSDYRAARLDREERGDQYFSY